MTKAATMGKMDPTAYDRWWKARINKEEAAIADRKTVNPTVMLNTLGIGQEVPTASKEGSHLVGAGAMVKQPKPVALTLPGADARELIDDVLR